MKIKINLKYIIISIAILIAIVLSYLLYIFHIRVIPMDVQLVDYSISDDSMKISVFVGASIGYIHSMDTQSNGEDLYLTFYSTHGLNNPKGAENIFTIDKINQYENVYFYVDTDDNGKDKFKKVLYKDSNGDWLNLVQNN